MKLKATASANASIQLADGTPLTEDTELDLSQPLAIVVIAQDKRHRKIYVLKLVQEQQVTLEVATRQYSLGDEPESITATTTSNLPLHFTSSQPNVAIIADGKIHVCGVGKTTLQAVQLGNATYRPARSSSVEIEVKKVPLNVTPRIAAVQYGHTLEWAFDYRTLVSQRHALNMPLEQLMMAYEIRNAQGELQNPQEVLPIGQYTIAPKPSAEVLCENYTLNLLSGAFAVEQGSIYNLQLAVVNREGKPIPHAQVEIEGKLLHTDGAGQLLYRLEGKKAYTFVVQADGYQRKSIDIQMQEANLPCRVELEKTAYTITYRIEGGGLSMGRIRWCFTWLRGLMPIPS